MISAAYIHIPFCTHICNYCDFNKVFFKGQPVDDYLLSLENEIKSTLDQHPAGELKSIYVGGGTPTALTEKQLDKLCILINENLPVKKDTEFTFEANPGDLSREKCRILYNAGVNRLSLGVQTFNDELLKKIGRAHRAKEVFDSVALAKNTGFHNINIDLIYGLPGQTILDFQDTLTASFSLDITHFSGYSLIIEPKTVFYNLLQEGKLALTGEDEEAEMYELLMEEMGLHGYSQYEISNFSLPGYESRHNLTYWNNDEYYGFGAGAHSYIEGFRCANYGPINQYIAAVEEKGCPVKERHKLKREEKIEEEMFLGLRKIEGVSVQRFIEKFSENPLRLFQKEIGKLQKEGLLTFDEKSIRLTKKGLFLGNEVFQEFIGVM